MIVVAYIALLLALTNCTVVIRDGSKPVAPSTTQAPPPLK
jgi:hypothetical protein